MKNIQFSLFLVFFSILSCNKDEIIELTPTLTSNYENLNGNYFGNIYKWNRNFDSTQTNVIEQFDTVFNQSGILVINEQTNKIVFNTIEYPVHDSLALMHNKDTIVALIDYLTTPLKSLTIIQSQKKVIESESASAPTGPMAYYIMGKYSKQ